MKTVVLDSLLRLFEIEREKLFFLQKNLLPFEDETLRESGAEAQGLISDSILRLKEVMLQKSVTSKSDLKDLLMKAYLKIYRLAYLLIQSDNYRKDRCVALGKMKYAKLGFETLIFSL